jgi:serine/threonine protein kinase
MGFASDCKPKENPESKKNKLSAFHSKQETPSRYEYRQEVEVTSFSISRLEQDYCLVQHLGKGHFSEVGLYESRLSGELFAIKTAKANRMSVNEVQALGSIWVLSGQCANVVRYYHSWIEEGELFLVMEYCQESLQKHISKHRTMGQSMPEKVIVSHLRAALLGLASIHKQGILHLDVKPENMLFKGTVLKIADFGLSRVARIRTDIEEGDSRYLAKEVLNLDARVDLTKADIFSLAVTAY